MKRSPDEQMDVIAHESIGIHLAGQARFPCLQGLSIVCVVVVGRKDKLLVVAPLDDVVGNPPWAVWAKSGSRCTVSHLIIPAFALQRSPRHPLASPARSGALAGMGRNLGPLMMVHETVAAS